MYKKFTLIEMIVTIVTLSIIAAIVLINIKDFKKNAIISSVEANRSIIQSASDAYYLQKSEYPIMDTNSLNLSNPQLIDIDVLVEEGYIKKELDTSKVKNQYYWVDVFGRVWGATNKEINPINLIKKKDNSKTLEFVIDNKISGFDVYEVSGYNHLLSADTAETDKKSYKVVDSVEYKGNDREVVSLELPKQNENYLISMKDEYGLELPPVGKFNGLKLPSYRSQGIYQFEINNEEDMYWVDFWTLENKKGDSSINYRFRVKDKNGEFLPWTEDFFSLTESKHIVVEIEIKADAAGNTAEVYDIQVLFKYKDEAIDIQEEQVCDIDCYEENLVCPASNLKTTYSIISGGQMVTPFYIKGKKSIENTYIRQPVLSSKYQLLKQVSYYVEFNGEYLLVSDTEQVFEDKCAVAIFDVEILGTPNQETEDKKDPIICGSGASKTMLYGENKKIVYQFKLKDSTQVNSIEIKPMSNLTNIYVEQSIDGKPYEIIDSLVDIQTPSCVNIVYEFETDITKPNPPIIHLCEKDCEKVPACIENCESSGPTCLYDCKKGDINEGDKCIEENCKDDKKEYCKNEYSECETPPCKESCSPLATDPEWVTVETMRFFGNGPLDKKTLWIDEVHENEILDDENTRIVYNYAKKNSSGHWSGLYEDFKKTGYSNAVMAVAFIQVKIKAVDIVSPADYPYVKSLTFKSEAGNLPASMTNPSLVISPKKDNNNGRDVFSNASKIKWEADVSDPRNLKIENIEWSGDVRDQYPVGKYTIKARATNERGYTSAWVSYSLEVLEEKPIALYSIQEEKKYIPTNKKIVFNQFESIDPDGDEIVNYEWENKKTTYSKEDVGPIKIRLRVEDEEGNWSDWFEKEFVIYDSENEFWNVDGVPATAAGYGNAFDKDDTSNVDAVGNVTITWNENIEGRTLRLYANLYSFSETKFSFYDENNNELESLSSLELYSKKHVLPKSSNFKVIVPKGATSLKFTGAKIMAIYSIDLLETTTKIPTITDLVDTSSKYNHSAKFKKETLVDKTFFIDTKNNAYAVTSGNFISKSVSPDTKEPYKVVSVDSEFNASTEMTVYLKTLVSKVNFYGLNENVFDEDDSTGEASVKNATVTWDKNIEGETLYVFALLLSGGTNNLSFHDEQDNPLYFLTDTHTFTNSHKLSNNKAVKVIVPEGARSLKVSGTVKNFSSIHLIDKTQDVPKISNLVDKSEKYKHVAEFEKDSIVKNTYFINSENTLFNVTGNVFNSTPVIPNTNDIYKVINVDSNFISSEITTVNLKTLPSDMNFYGLPIAAFDEDDETVVSAVATPSTITWDKDISGETISILVELYSFSPVYVSFLDENQNELSFRTTAGSETTKHSLVGKMENQIIVPVGATSLKFTGSKILRFKSLHLVK